MFGIEAGSFLLEAQRESRGNPERGEAMSQGPEQHTSITDYFLETGFDFYRRLPAVGPPPKTDFRWLLAVFFHDPGSEEYSFYVPVLHVSLWRLNVDSPSRRFRRLCL
jgi:hypothetical protein